MKTTENSSNDLIESIRRLFSGMLLGSLLVFISTVRLSGQCSITLSSVPDSDNQTLCINTAITDITYITSVATGADFSGLPDGVTGSWADSTVTITGTPTVAGTFNYTVTATGGICENITASGTINVTADNTITLTSEEGTDNQTVCINTAITNITYSVTGAINASVGGLPQGVSAYWESDEVLINGAPSESGNFTYTITLSGGCGNINETGNITVNPLPETPVITASGPTTFCEGGSVTLTSGEGVTYLWSTGETLQSIEVATSGSYSVQITDENGCQSAPSAETVVTVDQLPTPASIDVSPLNYCGTLTSGSLGGNTPESGTGIWSIVSGGTGSFSDPASGSSTFTADDYGTYVLQWTISNGTCTPVSADVTVIYSSNYNKTFVAGWNWFSVNTLPGDMSLNSVLSSGFTDGDYIKNQTTFSFYSSASGWTGSLVTIDPTDLYVVRVQNMAGIDFCGTPVDVNSTPISLVEGWNWIGYTPSFPLPISDALGSLSSIEGDYIKSQTLYADYYSTGWFGSLTQLKPGEGYMMRLAYDDELFYPDSPSKSDSEENIIQQKYFFSPYKYEFNGSVSAQVLIDGIPAGSEKDILYAYVDDEIRGVAQALYIKPSDSYIFPLMIYSNKTEGEIISFIYYDYESDRNYNCIENIPFRADMIISNPFKSFSINAVSDQKSMRHDNVSDVALKVYPNPFDNVLNIEFEIPYTANVILTVSDQFGKTLRVLMDQELNPDNYSLKWICDLEHSGLYFIQLQAGNRYTIRKVVRIP